MIKSWTLDIWIDGVCEPLSLCFDTRERGQAMMREILERAVSPRDGGFESTGDDGTTVMFQTPRLRAMRLWVEA